MRCFYHLMCFVLLINTHIIAQNSPASREVILGNSFKIEVPVELSTQITRGPDFKIFELIKDKSTVVSIYVGDHPDTSSFTQHNATKVKFNNVNAEKTVIKDGTKERTEFLVTLDTKKSPHFAHIWFEKNIGQVDSGYILGILNSMKRDEKTR